MKLKVTLKKSAIGRSPKQRATLRGLGLTRVNRVRVVPDTPATRGMLSRVGHLVEWQEVNE